MTEHWLDVAKREKRPLNLDGHINRPRISASTILSLMQLKNKLSGTNLTIHEQSELSADKSTV